MCKYSQYAHDQCGLAIEELTDLLMMMTATLTGADSCFLPLASRDPLLISQGIHRNYQMRRNSTENIFLLFVIAAISTAVYQLLYKHILRLAIADIAQFCSEQNSREANQ